VALLAVLLAAGCSVVREVSPGRSIGSFDYCVVSPKDTGEYFDTASSILNQSFVVLRENDPRLIQPDVREKACAVSIQRTPGFWSSSGWVEVTNYESGAEVLTSHLRSGMVWTGSDADVVEALQDVAAARAAGPPVPAEARNPANGSRPDLANPATAPRSKTERLTELNDLKAQGLITDAEYEKQRTKIIEE
jgi:hypothetical protein